MPLLSLRPVRLIVGGEKLQEEEAPFIIHEEKEQEHQDDVVNKKIFENDDSKDDDGSEDDDDEEEDDEIYFPIEEVTALEKRGLDLERSLPVINLIPTGAGILQNLQLVGVFPTARWLDDKTMPADVREMFGGTPFFALGEYRVAHLVILDAKRRKNEVTIILNTGVEGMKTCFWGGTFDRSTFECLAKFEFTGDFETTIKEQRRRRTSNNRYGSSFSFSTFDNLDFANGFCDTSHVICFTQFERILAIAVEFILELDWKGLLPESLVEIRDMSPRSLRRKRAQERTTPRSTKREKSPFV